MTRLQIKRRAYHVPNLIYKTFLIVFSMKTVPVPSALCNCCKRQLALPIWFDVAFIVVLQSNLFLLGSAHDKLNV